MESKRSEIALDQFELQAFSIGQGDTLSVEADIKTEVKW